jgi:uncharacterized membrane protein YgaE (UPF0421/DUF939 family)
MDLVILVTCTGLGFALGVQTSMFFGTTPRTMGVVYLVLLAVLAARII